MRIGRIGPAGSERPVAEGAQGNWWELGALCPRMDAARLHRGFDDVAQELGSHALQPVRDREPRWGSPIERPGKIVGIGLNYHDHAAEIGAAAPREPAVFLKANSSFCGPNDDIVMLPGSTTTDYEVELGVVLGRRLQGCDDDAQALAAVAGYVLAHDVSDRDLQLQRGGTWTKGKSADTFCPTGPYLVTPDAFPARGVTLRTTVNDILRQHGHTQDMIFGVAALLRYVSALMTLEPGDLVLTGTPSGVAMADPANRPYLHHADRVRVDGDLLGTQRCTIVDPIQRTSPLGNR